MKRLLVLLLLLAPLARAQTQLATDTFTGADQNPLAGNWSNVSGTTGVVQRLSGTATEVVPLVNSAFSMVFWNAVAFPADQWCEMSFVAQGAGSYDGPGVRVSSPGNGYVALYNAGAGTINLDKMTGGSPAAINAPVAAALTPGDKLRIEVVATTITVKINGVVKLTVTDATFATGSGGMMFYAPSGQSSSTSSYWAAGNFLTPPAVSAPPVVFVTENGKFIPLPGNAGYTFLHGSAAHRKERVLNDRAHTERTLSFDLVGSGASPLRNQRFPRRQSASV
jgi:hypothetical protein